MRGYRLLFGMMACGAASIACAADLTPAQQAFADAQALATGAQAGALANVGSGGVAATVNQFNPTYYNSSGTAPESALFQGGNGNTNTAGATKVSDCATGAANPDPFLRQNCEAINLMVRNPTTRPTISIPPSLFAASKAIEADPSALAASHLGYTDPSAVGSFTGCANNTVTTPATYSTEICNEFAGSSEQLCTVGRVLLVDANTKYLCDKSVITATQQTCSKTLNVTVAQPDPVATAPLRVDSINTSVGTYRAQTFNFTITSDGLPGKSYVLTHYQADNYGQLWLNGTLIYQNFSATLYQNISSIDIRNATFAQGDRCAPFLFCFLSPNGNPLATYYDYGCDSGCRGVAPNMDLTQYIKTGDNQLTFVCANAGGPGPCNVTIGTYSCPSNHGAVGVGLNLLCVPPPVITPILNNGCASLEVAAQ